MHEQIVLAGFGGQGVMLMGQLLTYAGMFEEKEVSWLPSYGPEMRGGTANCHVTISDNPIGSPIIVEGTAGIFMNLPSLEKFEKDVKSGGTIFINSSLISKKSERDDAKVYYVPANELAEEVATAKAANMVMLGAVLAVMNIVSLDTVQKVMEKTMTGTKAKFIPMNLKAIERGMKYIKENYQV